MEILTVISKWKLKSVLNSKSYQLTNTDIYNINGIYNIYIYILILLGPFYEDDAK